MIRASILSTIWIVLPASAATSYFASSVSGLDSNPGTLTQPFRTLTRCLDAISGPGDVCNLREGVYEASPKIYTASGTPQFPIELRGYQREKATIQQGVFVGWRREAGTNTWSTAFDLDAHVAAQKLAQAEHQYFERGIRVWKGNEILQEATWPQQLTATFTHPTWTAAAGSNDAIIYNSNIKNVDLTGAKVLTFNGDQTGVDARTVLGSGLGWVRISGATHPWSTVGMGSRFWIQGVRNMITSFNQWGYDPVQKRVFLRTTGYDPNQVIRIQTTSIAFTLRGVSNWAIYNLNFQGTSPYARGLTNQIRYSGLYVREPGLVRWPDKPYDFIQFSGMILGAKSRIHHSTFDGCDARCLYLLGESDTADNNLVMYGGRIGQYEGAISVAKPNAVIRRNRIIESGRDAIGFQTTDIGGAIVRRNSIDDCGVMANEGAGITLFRIATPAGSRVRIDSNLIRRMRGNSVGIYLEGSRGVDIFRNVFADMGTAISLVGDDGAPGLYGNRIVSNSGHMLRNSLFLRNPGNLAGTLLANNILSGGFVQSERHPIPLVEYPLSFDGLLATGVSYFGNLGPGVDPLFTAGNYQDFTLSPASPARGTGTILPGVNYGAGADPALSFPGATPDIGAVNAGSVLWPFGNYDETVGNPILGMEDPSRWHSFWTTDLVIKSSSTDRVQGEYSLSLQPLPWAPLESDPIEWDLVQGAHALRLSFKVPETNKWIGYMQVFYDAPSLGIWNHASDNIPLGLFQRGKWVQQGISFDQLMLDKVMTKTRIKDFRIRLVYNAEAGGPPLLIDNLSFSKI
jgi:hypothetical protein